MANPKTKAAAKKPAAAPSPEEIEFIERRVWNFCRTPDDMNQDELYIHPNTSFPDFKADSVGDLSFHANGLVEPALSSDIELFAADLHIYLDGFDISPKTTASVARSEVRQVARDDQKTIQDLLDTVVANYQENPTA
jgi:hypothetical protein